MPKSKGDISYCPRFIETILNEWNTIPPTYRSQRKFAKEKGLHEATLRSWIKKSRKKNDEIPTNSKKDIVQWLIQQPKTISADEILEHLKKNHPSVLLNRSYDSTQKFIKRIQQKTAKMKDGYISTTHNIHCGVVPTHAPTAKCDCKKLCGQQCANRLMMVECTDSICKAFNCTNRAIQKGKIPQLQVKNFEGKGQGLVANESIRSNKFIIEYCRELINEELCNLRKERHRGTYIFSAGNCFIDGSKFGNESRFINHSCRPNCKAQEWNVGGKIRVAIYSKKAIKKGEEITLKYGYNLTECFCTYCINKNSKTK